MRARPGSLQQGPLGVQHAETPRAQGQGLICVLVSTRDRCAPYAQHPEFILHTARLRYFLED